MRSSSGCAHAAQLGARHLALDRRAAGDRASRNTASVGVGQRLLDAARLGDRRADQRARAIARRADAAVAEPIAHRARSRDRGRRRRARESPPVAFTSNTPSTSFRIEMSNVPPPRSNTAYVPLAAAVEAVRERRRRRLGEQPHHLEPGEPARVARRLALRVVEVRRHRDHRALDRPAERRLGARLELAQDLGRDLDRRDHAPARDPHLHRAVVALELVRQHRAHGARGPSAPRPISRFTDASVSCGASSACACAAPPDDDAAVGRVVHDRRHQRPALAAEHHAVPRRRRARRGCSWSRGRSRRRAACTPP